MKCGREWCGNEETVVPSGWRARNKPCEACYQEWIRSTTRGWDNWARANPKGAKMSETKKCDSGLCRRAITAQGDEALQAVVNLDEAFAAERAANEATKRELAEVVRAVSQHLSTGVKGGDSDPTWNIKEAGKTIDQLRAEVEHLKRHQFNASMAAAMLDLRDAVKGDQRAPSHVVVKEAIAEVERLRGELARAVTISEVDPYNWYGEEDRKSRWLSDFLEQQRALHSVVSDGNARTDDPRPIDGNYIRANLSNKAKQSQPEPAKGVEDLMHCILRRSF